MSVLTINTYKRGIGTLLALMALMATGCEIPGYPPGNAGTTEGLGGVKKPPVLAAYPTVNEMGIAPLTEPIPDGFIRGVDISNCYIIEQAGGVYYDDNGTPGDVIQILADHGVNYVRLRLWHNHQLAYNPGPYNGDGDNDMVKTRAIAKRAKEAGMKFLLNFHYSDNWADPGRQQIPDAWKEYTVDQLVQAVYDYTLDTILELKAAGAEPDMVQIGNEIRPGMLMTTGGSGSVIDTAANLGRVLEAGIQAARLAAPNAKIMVHLDAGGDTSIFQTWFDRFAAHNGAGATVQELDFDVIGLSWYPYYSSHKNIADLDANIRNIVSRYGKEAVVAEHSWAWTKEYDGDDLSNLFHTSQETLTAAQMPASDSYVTASGIVFEGSRVPASVENQARVLRAVLDATVTSGGMGVFWWGTEWIPATGLKSNWDNQTLFDFNGKALPALSVLGGLGTTAGITPPKKPANLRATATTIDSISLAWNASSGTDVYALYRAASATGPWDETTLVSDTLTVLTYNDTGLAPGTTYYYAVKAHNDNGWSAASDPLTAAAKALTAPEGFRVDAVTTTSITLTWNAAADGVTAFKIYHAGPEADKPADNAFTALTGADNIAFGATTHTHGSLSIGEKHWYKLAAVYGGHGEGPRSAAVSGVPGTALPPSYAAIDMNTGTLDADFSDGSKAASSTDSQSPGSGVFNYDIAGLYVANDETNLYIAVGFGGAQPGGYEYDRIVVLIDNTDSSDGGVNTGTVKAAQTTTCTASIEAFAQRIMRDTRGGFTSTPGGAINAGAWTGGDADPWVWKPTAPAGTTTVKFSIPLANIGGAVAGNTLKVFAAFSKGWSNGATIVVGDIIPQAAASGAGEDATSITIDMDQALSYTVK
ncbi:MAG: glycosyl hydrolase 53 family protein [Treponema sp.]|nr:glycosyl hydrolase 53 family protein [Treponema sp.]